MYCLKCYNAKYAAECAEKDVRFSKRRYFCKCCGKYDYTVEALRFGYRLRRYFKTRNKA